MIDMRKPGSRGAPGRRLALAAAAALATTAAGWIAPPPAPPAAPSPGAGATVAPPPAKPRPLAAPAVGHRSQPGRPALTVVRWSLRSGNGENVSATGHAPAGRPLTLQLQLVGTQAAVDRIRRGPIAIEVHWTRESGGPWSAPNLVTRLTIGHPGIAGALAAEVRRTGYFEWHSWARKDSLSPGRWQVSLTYPDGRPLACGNPPAPCRFRIDAG
jgi:hypothetical protein